MATAAAAEEAAAVVDNVVQRLPIRWDEEEEKKKDMTHRCRRCGPPRYPSDPPTFTTTDAWTRWCHGHLVVLVVIASLFLSSCAVVWVRDNHRSQYHSWLRPHSTRDGVPQTSNDDDLPTTSLLLTLQEALELVQTAGFRVCIPSHSETPPPLTTTTQLQHLHQNRPGQSHPTAHHSPLASGTTIQTALLLDSTTTIQHTIPLQLLWPAIPICMKSNDNRNSVQENHRTLSTPNHSTRNPGERNESFLSSPATQVSTNQPVVTPRASSSSTNNRNTMPRTSASTEATRHLETSSQTIKVPFAVPWTTLWNALAVAICVGIAALAAGLTLGMLGLDPLLLLIKQRAADSLTERQAAQNLLPIVQQRHRLLVTLLLLNAAANEALPLFLEQLVPPAMAVIVSVTLVLFFGEIIPSAIFTGPNQLYMAHALVPLVKMVMWVLYPIAGPIAALLDYLLHGSIGHDNDDEHDSTTPVGSSATFTRGELSALIRIQYEERLALRNKRKAQKRDVVVLQGDRVGALDFTPTPSYTDPTRQLIRTDPLQKSLRALKNQATHGAPLVPPTISTPIVQNHQLERTYSSESYYSMPNHNHDVDERWLDHSIHPDEVTMVEGALQMRTKVALDVFTAMRKVFCIPSTTLLNEGNMVKIYSSGFSRIPVHEPGHKTRIVGILVTKMLIVVDPKDARPVSTLPLRRPRCVSPSMPLVNLLNMFQSSGCKHRGGHLALVCARPSTGEKAMTVPGQSLPEAAGLMGIITLEDVLESLLQEQIFDEMDRIERNAYRLARTVWVKWRQYVERKKAGLVIPGPHEPILLPVVEHVVATARLKCRTKAFS